MRRAAAVCLLLFFVFCAYSTSLAERRPDLSSSSKGFATGTCSTNQGGTIPWFVAAASNPAPLYYPAGSNASNATYEVSVVLYDWGVTDCTNPDAPAELAPSTIIEVHVTQLGGSASSIQLRSITIAAALTNPGLVACDLNGGIAHCNQTPLYSNDPLSFSQYSTAEPTSIARADGTNTLWSFGPVYYTDQNGNSSAGPLRIQNAFTTSPPDIASAVLVADGTVASNNLASSALLQVTLIDANQNVIVLGAPQVPTTSGAQFNSLQTAYDLPVDTFQRAYDLSNNLPLEGTGGAQLVGPGNYPAPPCLNANGADSTDQVLAFRSIWFNYTATSSVPVTISTAGSHFDTVLTVYTGSTPVSTDLCNDDFPFDAAADTVQSELSFNATAGTTYHVMVTEEPPPNPLAVTLSNPISGAAYGTGGVFPLGGDPLLYLALTTPQLTPSTTALASFGSEDIGSTTAAQQVTLTAQYSAAAGGVTLNATTSGDFHITSPACASPLADRKTCTLTVVFTPTAAGLRTGTLTITSSAENSPLTFALSGTGVPPAALTVTSTTLPVAVIGSTYSGTLQATGGIPPYDWTVVSGSLPTNLSLQATTGVISGAPTQTGTSTFTIQVSDSESPAAMTTAQLTLSVEEPGALQFVPVAPCRIADTRNPTGPFGGPAIAAKEIRSFTIPQSACGIPSTAAAYALNVTVVPEGPLDFLTVWPAGQAQPTVSLLNSIDGRIKANAAIIPAGVSGAISVYPSAETPTHVVIDISGYFIPATGSSLAFYPLAPCRIADTRNAAGPFGGPSLSFGQSRSFPVQASDCKVPAGATAYSLNITAVPTGPLNYLTLWPTGQAQPTVSTLNAETGTITANAAIVPAGSGGQVSVFVTNDSDIVMDINGYFAPPAAGGTSLYTTTPCRVLDTREYPASPFPGTYTVGVLSSVCTLPASATAYVLNATVVPSQPLGYLSLWPAGESQPLVSTLNAEDGSITSNMAIVPTNNGSIDAYATSETQLILDISSYFAP
jgi:Putative Ig domain